MLSNSNYGEKLWVAQKAIFSIIVSILKFAKGPKMPNFPPPKNAQNKYFRILESAGLVGSRNSRRNSSIKRGTRRANNCAPTRRKTNGKSVCQKDPELLHRTQKSAKNSAKERKRELEGPR